MHDIPPSSRFKKRLQISGYFTHENTYHTVTYIPVCYHVQVTIFSQIYTTLMFCCLLLLFASRSLIRWFYNRDLLSEVHNSFPAPMPYVFCTPGLHSLCYRCPQLGGCTNRRAGRRRASSLPASPSILCCNLIEYMRCIFINRDVEDGFQL